MTTPTIGIDNPFVGLRSFEPSESLLFHGRKQHTQQLLRVLASHRFVGVIGTSGSGKSSLVKAGLLPALHRGYLRGASSRWKTAVMRPGASPLSRLAEALCDPKGLALPGPPEDIATRLEENSAALVTLVRDQFEPDPDRDNLLLVVDQFEEVFRIHQEGARDAAFFVSLLLRARDELDVPIFIVLTLRSEYLGDCAQYPGLAEALSEAQYLIPRLTREQREEAIRGPLDMVGADIDDSLVQRLLNDAGDDPDQLPALQHALMKLYEKTPRGARLSLERYGKRLRVGRSLDFHAQAVYEDSLTAPQRKLAEKVFRCLTTTEDGREVRRPTKLGTLYSIVAADSQETCADVRAVVKAFALKENSLLFAGGGADLTDDTLVDISHESLIRQWDLLQEWVRREAEAADWFARLARSAQLHREGRGGLWGNPDAEFAFKGMMEDAWNRQWGDQYCRGFYEAKAFLMESLARIKAIEEEKQQRAREVEELRERKLQAAQQLAEARERELATSQELAATRERELQAAQQLAEAKQRELAASQELAATREREIQAAQQLAEAKQRELEVSQRGRKRLLLALAGLTASTVGLLLFAMLWQQERQQRIRALENQLTAVAGATRVNKADGQRYVYVPAGKFTMGCSTGDAECADDERTPHEVEITRGFWIGQTEVTQAAFEKVMKTNPSRFKGADRPVESVTWDDARAYCEAAAMRLPTEAEWEYAARAGSKEARYGALDQIAWYGGNSKDQTQPVAAKYPNAWGLYDMLGNVWEWTADWYDAKYYDHQPKSSIDPRGPSSPTGTKVLRGGSWVDYPRFVRVSFRAGYEPSDRYSVVGFRCAGELR